MSSTVLFVGAQDIAEITNVFSVNGAPTDPTAVSLTVVDPTGAITTVTYDPGTIVRNSTGSYTYSQACTVEGMWSYTWVGTGTASDVTAGTFTVSLTALNRLYVSVAELKSRIGMPQTDTSDDDQLLLACQSATRGIDMFCGRYFWQATDSRVFPSQGIDICVVDDLVSVTTLATDTTGTNVYDTTWAASDYRLEPANAAGNNPEPRPYTSIRSMSGAGGHFFFPQIYPMSNPDRVKITGVFGWPSVPYLVKQAALQLGIDIYKTKDSPFGILGSPDFGFVRIKANPQVMGMLAPYLRGKKVGV